MCSQYTLFISGQKLLTNFSIASFISELPKQINDHVMPNRESWVVLKEVDSLTLARMRFSLLPSWSKESRLKFSTHNARLESVREKATWRVPFARQHCIVPMTCFVEPIYHNRYAGNMVRFSADNDIILSAAGIYDTWSSPDGSQQIRSFAIVTHDSDGIIKEEGHDRAPIFLTTEGSAKWLEKGAEVSDDWYNFLKNNAISPKLSSTLERPMKAGWEKRA